MWYVIVGFGAGVLGYGVAALAASAKRGDIELKLAQREHDRQEYFGETIWLKGYLRRRGLLGDYRVWRCAEERRQRENVVVPTEPHGEQTA